MTQRQMRNTPENGRRTSAIRAVPLALYIVVALFLAACATGPRYETVGVAADLVPSDVVSSPEAHRDTKVIWGGRIVATRNLAEYTELEVLGYPLSGAQRPETGRSPQGRFLVRMAGYLEEVDYAPGRLVTAFGLLGNNVDGRVGEAPYVYPVLQASDIHLWPVETSAEPSGRTRFNIGIGVILGR